MPIDSFHKIITRIFVIGKMSLPPERLSAYQKEPAATYLIGKYNKMN